MANLTVTSKMKKQFANAYPFPHAVFDNFIDSETISKVEQELRNLPIEVWLQNRDTTSGEMIQQQKKLAIKNLSCLGPNTQDMMKYFYSPEMIQYLEKLTGITGLLSDQSFLGGGVHRTDKGGKLSIHADFNIHPESGKHRRLNVLLYLNPKYKPEDRGQLELWDKRMTACEKKIEPVYNRMVVFRITDDAFHGHPEPWNGDDYRLSLAFYYYTDDRPRNEKAPFHWALWQQRPEKGW